MIDSYVSKHAEDTEVSEHHMAKFDGFDGNNETDLMGFTRFLVDTQGKFTESKKSPTDDFNSHSPMRHICERLVTAYNAWSKKGSMRTLERDDVLAMLNAALPPR